VDPAKALGPSAFGPLQFRIVAHGVAGDWQKLATLVRLPVLKDLTCPATPDLACKLSGSNLFLVDSVSNDPQFRHPVEVPDGFPGFALPVPHPVDGQLYVKVRDDPSVINMAELNVQKLAATPEEAARADARHEAAHKDPEITHTDPPRTDTTHTDTSHADAPAGSAATPFAGPPAPATVAPGSATPPSDPAAAGSSAPASTTSTSTSPAK
jgi:hypothetical protein